MNILAIETATSACAMALRTSEGVELELVVADERHHTEALTPGIRDLLAQVGLRASQIDRVVVDHGPGLYTGLRVGIATALGLALATGADLVTVTSLELLAHGAHAAGVRGALVACLDARRSELFAQSFELGAEVTVRGEPRVMTPSQVRAKWSHAPVTFTGDGAARYASELRATSRVELFDLLVPPAREALRLGVLRRPVFDVVPLYLREADAVANFSTRERFS